jgi:glycosyltransferase involved in cell wall biosynthesis
MTKKALVVIPTVGSPKLLDAVASVISQTHMKLGMLDLWIVVDGPEYQEKTFSLINDIVQKEPNVHVMVLPSNTGAGGFYGHRIYASVSYLFNHDYILYLDQDNWYDPDHVSGMVNACESNMWVWCHSLRKIFDENKSYICDDDCESLGRWPIYLSNDHHLVDTSTYCIRRDVIVNVAPAWYNGWGGDRIFYSAIARHYPNFGCTGKPTLNYRLDGNGKSVTADFFKTGNGVMQSRYNGVYPWRQLSR